MTDRCCESAYWFTIVTEKFQTLPLMSDYKWLDSLFWHEEKCNESYRMDEMY